MTTTESKNWIRLLPAALIVAVVCAVYANTLRAPFLFDDTSAILRNESIRNLWSPEIFNPPGGHGETVGGRPLLNASFAMNYAISGLDTWSYHLANTAIHALAALALFGLVRRALAKVEADAPAALNTRLAAAIALVWAAHPLCTGAVAYVVQRAESMCGLFVMLALYCFSRAVSFAARTSGQPPSKQAGSLRCKKHWLIASIIATFAGIATKEVAATIPILTLLYDRTFISGGFRAAWRAHRGYYLALASSWLLLLVLMTAQGGRGMSAGYASGMDWREYALTQCWAVTHYLRLAVWPAGQLFDYGIVLVGSPGAVWPRALLLIVLLAATAWALVRKPKAGFLGACFFIILAPTSSVVPVVTQTIAEHRMYLPLVAIVALVLGAVWKKLPAALPAFALALTVLLGAAAIARNHTYRSVESAWRDVAEKSPMNARAWTNLGVALQEGGRNREAMDCYERAVSINPNHAFAHGNWGAILLREGKAAGAIPHLRAAVELEPGLPDLRHNLARALSAEGKTKALAGRLAEAEALLREAVAVHPGSAEAHGNLGNVLLMQERVTEAAREYEEVLRLKPNDRGARENLDLIREYLRQR